MRPPRVEWRVGVKNLGRPRRKPEEVDDVAELGALADKPGREGPACGGGDLCGNQISGAPRP